MEQRSQKLMTAVAAVLLTASANVRAEEPAPPDTSNWKCSKCEFEQGYASEAELGAGYLDDASAKFGDYTGLDDDGAYVVAGAEGSAALESGYRLDYSLQDLGLDSRSIDIAGGKQGAYEFGLSYDRVPHTISDTGASVFDGIGGTDLTLPDGWVRAGSTGGMTALDSSLRQVDARLRPRPLRASSAASSSARTGRSASTTSATSAAARGRSSARSAASPRKLLRPVDDATDRVNASVRYEGAHWFAQVGYYLSLLRQPGRSVPLRQPVQLVRARAATWARWRSSRTTATTNWPRPSAGTGCPATRRSRCPPRPARARRTAAFAPYTINPDLTTDALPFGNLDGEVSVTRADLTVASRPLDRLRLRGAVAYDERDNDEPAGHVHVHRAHRPVPARRRPRQPRSTVTNARGSGARQTSTSIDDLAVGIGGEYRNDRPHRHDAGGHEREPTGRLWPRAVHARAATLASSLKGGVEERDPDNYDAQLGTDQFGQNPLMRKYQLAYRYRSYGELLANVAVGSLPVSLGAQRVLRRRQLPAVGHRARLRPRPPLRRRRQLGGQREVVRLCLAGAREDRLADAQQHRVRETRTGRA